MASKRFKRMAWLTVACASLVGCQPRSLSPLYCEGGVDAKGGEMGGECLAVSKEVIDSDPKSVGTGHWETGNVVDRYSLRRGGKNQYDMFLNGKLAGTIDRNDHWITVKVTDKPGRVFSLRDDPPGVFN